MVYKYVNLSKHPASLNLEHSLMIEVHCTYNTTYPTMLLNMLHRGYRIGELLLQINPSNSHMHPEAKTRIY